MKPLVGIFGGTFDPVHCGHLQAINELCQHLDFTRIHWVLSARPPHKKGTGASIDQRFEMLQLALADYPGYIADDCEIRRAEKSFTLDTVKEFEQRYPQHTLCLIIGVDSLMQLGSWQRYLELIEKVHIIALARPGYAVRVPEFMQNRVVNSVNDLEQSGRPSLAIFAHTRYDISSTHIRKLLQRSASPETEKNLQELLPDSVIDYIHRQQSYKMRSMKPEQIRDQVVTVLEDVKAQDIRVIDISDISDFADFMVIASGTSGTHVKALARAASDSLRRLGVKPVNEDGADIGEWVLVDFGDLVLHVMRPEVREYYDLEKLWDEDVSELLKQHREKQGSE